MMVYMDSGFKIHVHPRESVPATEKKTYPNEWKGKLSWSSLPPLKRKNHLQQL